MKRTLLIIRIVFILVCTIGGWLVAFTQAEWDHLWVQAMVVGFLIGSLVVLVDLLLKGFSLRGLSAVTFGLCIGSLIAFLIATSPLFEFADPANRFISRLSLFMVCSYLGTVIALRGKDEFNLVIPYVRFVPQEVDVPMVMVDTSALIDGRVVRICESGFLGGTIVIPQFVLQQLQSVADSSDPHKQARGRRGLDTLNGLRRVQRLQIRILESDVAKHAELDEKLIFLAQSMKAKILTTDFNLAKLAEFHGVPWLNLGQLGKALQSDLIVGDELEVDLVRAGKEENQAVGFIPDGSMVVVNQARPYIGRRVRAEVISVLPSSGGKMFFCRHLQVLP